MNDARILRKIQNGEYDDEELFGLQKGRVFEVPKLK